MTTAAHKTVGWDEPIAARDEAYAAMRAAKLDRDRAVLLFDARMACYRAFHTRDLSADDGTPTSALHGVIELIQAACDAANTRRWLVVWDGGLRYKRAVFPAYKERHDRQRTEDEQRDHDRCQRAIRVAREGLDALRAPQVCVEEIEADDAIGIAASVLGRLPRDLLAVVVSEDKDYYQLIDGRTLVWRSGRGELVGEAEFTARFAFPPARYVDFKAIVGEPATGDNIPGIPKAGEVTATKWVGTHGTLERMLAHFERLALAGRPLRKVEVSAHQHREQARLAYRLSKITRDAADLRAWGLDPKAVGRVLAPAVVYAMRTDRALPKAAVRTLKGSLGFQSFDAERWCSATGFVLT